MNRRVLFGALLAALTAAGCGGKKEPMKLIGRGSSFIRPLMLQWSYSYARTEDGCPIEYDAFGSGSGIEAIIANKVDFACTDAPLTDKQLAEARASGGELIHVPLVLGAVVPIYNLPEITEPLHFTGPVLADIFLGKIKRWNEKPIRDLNARVADRLPDEEIQVVHRSDGSGTTYIWADYLSKVSKEWKGTVGFGTKVPWPVGVGAGGNEGVAAHVEKTPRSIGYAELTYALRADLAFGLVQNRAGEYVRAGLRSIRAAVDNGIKDVPADLRFSFTNAPGKGSYPICGTTWAVVRVKPPAGKSRQIRDFIYWAVEGGKTAAEDLFYVPLPPSLEKLVLKQLARIQED